MTFASWLAASSTTVTDTPPAGGFRVMLP